jgi:hypothetical protein
VPVTQEPPWLTPSMLDAQAASAFVEGNAVVGEPKGLEDLTEILRRCNYLGRPLMVASQRHYLGVCPGRELEVREVYGGLARCALKSGRSIEDFERWVPADVVLPPATDITRPWIELTVNISTQPPSVISLIDLTEPIPLHKLKENLERGYMASTALLSDFLGALEGTKVVIVDFGGFEALCQLRTGGKAWVPVTKLAGITAPWYVLLSDIEKRLAQTGPFRVRSMRPYLALPSGVELDVLAVQDHLLLTTVFHDWVNVDILLPPPNDMYTLPDDFDFRILAPLAFVPAKAPPMLPPHLQLQEASVEEF